MQHPGMMVQSVRPLQLNAAYKLTRWEGGPITEG
jgi:hypothetical protein